MRDKAVSESLRQQFLAMLESLGGTAGSGKMQTRLGWQDELYREVYHSLVSDKTLSIGTGRGGSVRLRSAVEAAAAKAAAEAAKAEKKAKAKGAPAAAPAPAKASAAKKKAAAPAAPPAAPVRKRAPHTRVSRLRSRAI
jgi:type I restriction enzyme M protein